MRKLHFLNFCDIINIVTSKIANIMKGDIYMGCGTILAIFFIIIFIIATPKDVILGIVLGIALFIGLIALVLRWANGYYHDDDDD